MRWEELSWEEVWEEKRWKDMKRVEVRRTEINKNWEQLRKVWSWEKLSQDGVSKTWGVASTPSGKPCLWILQSELPPPSSGVYLYPSNRLANTHRLEPGRLRPSGANAKVKPDAAQAAAYDAALGLELRGSDCEDLFSAKRPHLWWRGGQGLSRPKPLRCVRWSSVPALHPPLLPANLKKEVRLRGQFQWHDVCVLFMSFELFGVDVFWRCKLQVGGQWNCGISDQTAWGAGSWHGQNGGMAGPGWHWSRNGRAAGWTLHKRKHMFSGS